MRISILIPTRDRLDYLRLSLASARAQRWSDVEILVSDDGSTDDTREFVRGVAYDDPRVRLLTGNPSPGVFSNVQYLVDQASGDAFTVLGDDDLLDDDFCALLAEPVQYDPSVILSFTDHRVIDTSGAYLEEASARSSLRYGRAGLPGGAVQNPVVLALRGGIWLGFALYRTAAFIDEPFDPECVLAADWDYAIRAARRGRIWFVPGRHGSYRDHRRTASRLGLPGAAAFAMKVLQKHRFDDEAAESLRRTLLRSAAKRHAFRTAPRDRSAARESLGLYRSLGGRWLNAHFMLTTLMLHLPPVAAGALQRLVWIASGSVARLRGAGVP
jgi:glycosyltransferase involved in cell wall biosynthesis